MTQDVKAPTATIALVPTTAQRGQLFESMGTIRITGPDVHHPGSTHTVKVWKTARRAAGSRWTTSAEPATAGHWSPTPAFDFGTCQAGDVVRLVVLSGGDDLRQADFRVVAQPGNDPILEPLDAAAAAALIA